MKLFSERLRELRIEAGYTQKKMAELLHMKQPSYSLYENGTGEPNLETTAQIARILHVSCDYLLGLSDF